MTAPYAEPMLVTVHELARLWRIKPRQVQRLADDGIAVRVAENRYDAWASTGNYLAALREQAAGRIDRGDAGARLREARAHLVELRLAREAGELILAADAKQTWVQIIHGIRSMMLSLPSRICFGIPTLTRADRDLIETIVRDDLEDAAMERGFLAPGAGEVPGGPAEAAGALNRGDPA